MNINQDEFSRKATLIGDAILQGTSIFTKGNTVNEFNKCCDHVHNLIEDSYLLYSNKSYATSVFISITAIEEICKIEISRFRERMENVSNGRKGDYLFSHSKKHDMGLNELIKMNSRLCDAIGNDALSEIFKKAKDGTIKDVRESAVYISSSKYGPVCSREIITQEISRNYLLVAIEVWYETFFGLTSHANEIDKRMDELFELIAKQDGT